MPAFVKVIGAKFTVFVPAAANSSVLAFASAGFGVFAGEPSATAIENSNACGSKSLPLTVFLTNAVEKSDGTTGTPSAEYALVTVTPETTASSCPLPLSVTLTVTVFAVLSFDQPFVSSVVSCTVYLNSPASSNLIDPKSTVLEPSLLNSSVEAVAAAGFGASPTAVILKSNAFALNPSPLTVFVTNGLPFTFSSLSGSSVSTVTGSAL